MINRDSGMTRIFTGDCRHMLELADNSIHCVVTSPPYLTQRKYAGEQALIWGGRADCRHEWLESVSVGRTNDQRPGPKQSSNAGSIGRDQPVSSGFCSICGAWKGGFGLEPTIEMYIEHTIEVLREVRRVLRPDGVVFWNLGDSYSHDDKWGGQSGGINETSAAGGYPREKTMRGLKPKDACLIPFRVAIAAQSAGWWVRSIIIWNKSNPMPESVNGWRWEKHRIKVKAQGTGSQKKNLAEQADYGRSRPDNIGGVFQDRAEFIDCPGCEKCSPNDGLVLRKGAWRPTDAHEYIIMLTKSGTYYCDLEAVREAYTKPANRWGGTKQYENTAKSEEYFSSQQLGSSSTLREGNSIRPDMAGRNLRSVWSFPTRPYTGAHFATFPEKLPETCIKAATPEHGVCAKCGSPWARIIEKSAGLPASWHNSPMNDGKNKEVHPDVGVTLRREAARTATQYEEGSSANRLALLWQQARENGGEYVNSSKTIGWRPTCKCGTLERVPATVLDPFMGSGTTLSVAQKLGRRSVGYDLAADYAPLADDRVGPPVMELL